MMTICPETMMATCNKCQAEFEPNMTNHSCELVESTTLPLWNVIYEESRTDEGTVYIRAETEEEARDIAYRLVKGEELTEDEVEAVEDHYQPDWLDSPDFYTDCEIQDAEIVPEY